MQTINYIRYLIVSTGVALALLFSVWNYNKRNLDDAMTTLTVINTETGTPDSFDPIDADKNQNLSVMRLLYATPIFISATNEIKSALLKQFSFDQKSKTVIFEVRDDIKFSDGRPITAQDIAMSIARFAYFHPEFPVINKILGVLDWSKKKQGLAHFPDGIKVTGAEIKIKFSSTMINPLFRFCLEVFSVVPRASIDLKSGKIIEKTPPFSGFYKLENQSDKSLVFEKRSDVFIPDTEGDLYNTITVIFKSASDACDLELKDNEVLAGYEMSNIHAKCLDKDSKSIYWMPTSRFGLVLFNPNEPAFDTKEKRQFFSEKIRLNLRNKYKHLKVEKSLFTKLLPGYLDSSEFSAAPLVNVNEFEGKSISIPWMPEFSSSVVYEAMIDVAKELKMNVKLIDKNISNSDFQDSFINGSLPITYGGSGFWAQDPIGDLQMLFTVGFHRNLYFVWQDLELYKKLKKLDESNDGKEIQDLMRDFNRYIIDQSLISPVLHARRFYKTSEGQRMKDLPQAVTSPSLWQLKLKRL